MSVLASVYPNSDNFVSAGIVNMYTRSTLIGCLLCLKPNKETKVKHTVVYVRQCSACIIIIIASVCGHMYCCLKEGAILIVVPNNDL